MDTTGYHHLTLMGLCHKAAGWKTGTGLTFSLWLRNYLRYGQ